MIRGFVYDKKTGSMTHEKELEKILRHFKNPRVNVWIDFENPSVDELRMLETHFGFHPLAVEDVTHGHQRSKLEDYGTYSFIVIRVPTETTPEGSTQFNIFLGHNFLVTANIHSVPIEQKAIDRCAKNPRLLLRGADFVLYTLLDCFVDAMFPKMNELDDKVDDLEDEIFKTQNTDVIEDLFNLKHEIVRYRRLIVPMRDVLNVLSRRDSPFVSEKNTVYFRDVYDHLVRLTETADSLRDVATSAMEAYLSAVSNNLNAIMKKLAAITVIIMVPALISGIFGMNFAELEIIEAGGFSFYVLLALMAASAIGFFFYFRIRKWI